MTLYYALSFKDDVWEKYKLNLEQQNDLYEMYGEYRKTKKQAIKDAEEYIEWFNKKHNTSFKWQELIGIESGEFQWNEDEEDWERI